MDHVIMLLKVKQLCLYTLEFAEMHSEMDVTRKYHAYPYQKAASFLQKEVYMSL